jgi:hypothetical protein
VTPHYPPHLLPNPFFFFFLLGGCKSKSQLFQKGRKTVFRVLFYYVLAKEKKIMIGFFFMFGKKEKRTQK